MKICSKCKVEKPLHAIGGNGSHSWCKACLAAYRRARRAADPEADNARMRKWRALNRDKANAAAKARRDANPEKIRAYQRQWRANSRTHTERNRRSNWDRYGIDITAAEFERRWAEQQGRCALCLQKPKRQLDVDHCHITGHIRGLLCNRCNRALGALGDTPEALRRVVDYLEGRIECQMKKAA